MTKFPEFGGVGALIISPNNTFLAITELESSQRTIKVAGMQSLPMESRNDNETPDQTLARLFTEEVSFPGDLTLPKMIGRICSVQIGQANVQMYLFESAYPYYVTVGTDRESVANPVWIPLQDVATQPVGSIRFRPGNREAISSYLLQKNQSPNLKTTPYFGHTFDAKYTLAELEKRSNQNAAQSQPDQMLQPFPAGPSLVR